MSTLPRNEENRRRAARYPTCVETRICYGPRDSVAIPCTIRNISTGGALIEANEVSLLPLAFRLMNPRLGRSYDCRVVWRRGNQVGVSFTRTIDLKDKLSLGARALRTVKSLVKR